MSECYKASSRRHSLMTLCLRSGLPGCFDFRFGSPPPDRGIPPPEPRWCDKIGRGLSTYSDNCFISTGASYKYLVPYSDHGPIIGDLSESIVKTGPIFGICILGCVLWGAQQHISPGPGRWARGCGYALDPVGKGLPNRADLAVSHCLTSLASQEGDPPERIVPPPI